MHQHHGNALLRQGKAKITIDACPRAVRRFGGHLVEASVNLRAIQHEMAHVCPKTTMLYTQLTDVTHQNTVQLINRLVNRLNLNFDGEV